MAESAAAVIRVLALALWGTVLLQSSLSGRLDLLLRGGFHPLVGISGALLLVLAALATLAACMLAIVPEAPSLDEWTLFWRVLAAVLPHVEGAES